MVDKVNSMSSDIANQVFESIHSLMHLYRAQQYRSLRDGPFELTHMEFKVLAFFARHPGSTQSDLVAHSGRDKAQLARLMQGLKSKGFVQGCADQTDRRSIRMELTATGHEVFNTVEEQGRHVSISAVKGLTDAECQQLNELLARVRANIENAN